MAALPRYRISFSFALVSYHGVPSNASFSISHVAGRCDSMFYSPDPTKAYTPIYPNDSGSTTLPNDLHPPKAFPPT